MLHEHLDRLAAVDEAVRAELGADDLPEVLAQVPDEWLEPVPGARTPAEVRAAYVELLTARLATRAWLPTAVGGAR